jgi:hypothetical protein
VGNTSEECKRKIQRNRGQGWVGHSVDGKTVFSEDLGPCVPTWKNPSRTCRCKWGLLKVRKGIQREHVGCRWSLMAESVCFSFSGAFKTYTNLWGGQT